MRRTTAIMSAYKASEQTGEVLSFEACKGGYFSDKEEYGLKAAGSTGQDGVPSPDVPLPIRCVKSGTKIRAYGKNLLPYPFADSNKTYYNNIEFTDNGDGSITFSGTNTSSNSSTFYLANINKPVHLNKGTYTITDSLGNTAGCTMFIRAVVNGELSGSELYNFSQSAKTFTTEGGDYAVYFIVPKDITHENVTVKIQLEKGETATEYEPFTEPSEITVPCDLYEGDIFYPTGGRVERYSEILKLSDCLAALSYIPATEYNSHYYYYLNLEGETYNGVGKSTHFTHSSSYGAPGSFYTDSGFYILALGTDGFIDDDPTCEAIKTWCTEQEEAGNPVLFTMKKITPTEEYYTPQPILAPKGRVNVIQLPTDIGATLTATMLCI